MFPIGLPFGDRRVGGVGRKGVWMCMSGGIIGFRITVSHIDEMPCDHLILQADSLNTLQTDSSKLINGNSVSPITDKCLEMDRRTHQSTQRTGCCSSCFVLI